MKKSSILLPIYLALAIVAGILIGVRFINTPKWKHDGMLINFHKYNKVNDVINYIQEDYVDSVNRNKLEESAINGMLESLDPHSVYIPASEFKDANDVLLGNFEGIGVQFRIENDTIVVILPVHGGPSEKAGILAGDRIVKVDGENVVGIHITNKDVMHRLKGDKGSKVLLGIYRKAMHKYLEFNIIRDVIPTYSVDIAYVVKPGLGYIKVSKFSETTDQEFSEALKKLNSRQVKKLIVDLRGNSGGYLKSAIKIADEFLPDKTLVVYTKGKSRGTDYAYATRGGLYEKNELVILIDEFSASASEIVAGAIQDNDRGTIIGRRSFGKGLVQEQLPLYDGSAIRLTIARYYTPTGRCIQRPYKEGTQAYYHDFYEEVISNGHYDTLPEYKNDTLKYTTPKGKVVYGGGGITPDIIVPANDGSKFAWYNELLKSGVIYQFSFYYTDNHRKALEKYKNASDFISNFRLTDKILNDFLDFIAKNDIRKNDEGFRNSKEKIRLLLKAFIGRNMFDDAAFYPVYLQTDKIFLRAVSFLDNERQ